MATEEKALPAPVETSASAPISTLTDQLVDDWFVETFHNIGLDTPQFNRFSAARHDLKSRLRRALTTKE